ncbi:MAG: hypothetical protein F6J95_028095 [Leptolyngbya sp. SIO1E4]|nr:hypothetical protein [Leptolyngbya sp. SIO1E4]
MTQQSRQSRAFWLGLSLVLATVYGLLAVRQAFESAYVVQDDARQHIFWMQRYLDPELFPGDLIADYFQSAAPLGYSGLYRLMAALGVEPAFFSKILPPFLGIITAGYGFFLCLEIFPVPVSGFISSAVLSQTLWASDELSSATPRAFLYPLLIAFLYYLLRRSLLACLVLIGLQVLLYPQAALVSLGLVAIRLVHWQDGKFSFSQNRQDYLLLIVGFCMVLCLALYTRGLSEFGAIVTRAEAESMPEFQEKGRNAFFLPGIRYWLDGYPGRSGILHRRTALPITVLAGLFLPPLLWLRPKSPIRQQVKAGIHMLTQLLLISFILYGLAHLLLFQLHLPSRYTSHTIRVVLVLAAGLAWTLILENTFRACQSWKRSVFLGRRRGVIRSVFLTFSQTVPLTLTAALFISLFFYYPLFLNDFPKAVYYDFSEAQPIYEFFAAQPKDTLIASLSDEASNLPTFSGRSVLVSREHSLAYHKAYYRQFRQRTEDLINAQYSDDPAVLLDFIETYQVDFWLLDRYAFQDAYVAENSWLQQFQPMADDAVSNLRQGATPVLQQSIETCTALPTEDWLILEAECIGAFAAARPSTIAK